MWIGEGCENEGIGDLFWGGEQGKVRRSKEEVQREKKEIQKELPPSPPSSVCPAGSRKGRPELWLRSSGLNAPPLIVQSK